MGVSDPSRLILLAFQKIAAGFGGLGFWDLAEFGADPVISAPVFLSLAGSVRLLLGDIADQQLLSLLVFWGRLRIRLNAESRVPSTFPNASLVNGSLASANVGRTRAAPKHRMRLIFISVLYLIFIAS